MSKETSDALMTDLKRNPMGVLGAAKLRIMPNAQFSAGASNIRHVDVTYNEVQDKYEMNFQEAQYYPNGETVQYLPWANNAGIYLILQDDPRIFFTDKLTGCYIVFDFTGGSPKISHLNFKDYSEEDKKSTLESYSEMNVLCPQDYLGDTTVFGVRDDTDGWQFFFQVNGGNSGSLTMSDTANAYGTKSVVLNNI